MQREGCDNSFMKVLFIVPPEETYIGASSHKSIDYKREHRPRLGIMSVATYLRQNRQDVEVRFLDCIALEMNFSDLEREILDFKPHLAGITCLTFTYIDCLRTASIIKLASPETKVCLGGFHVTLYPEETLSQKDVDIVLLGEGEQSMLDLVNYLDKGIPEKADISGLGFKENGALFVNKDRPVMKSLEDVPFPDYDLVNINRYSHVLGGGDINLAIESSRGCPFGCIFCDIRHSNFRYRSAVAIVDEIERLVAKGVHSFFTVDDNLTVNKKRVIKICELIVKRKLKIDFKVSSRVDTVNEEVLYHLKQAGCSKLSIGLESSNQKYLDFLGKNITVENIIETIQTAHKVGLPVFAYVMFGLPDQTREEMMEEVEFLKRYKVEYASFSICTIYPKTLLYYQCLENGHITHDPWPEFARNPRNDVKIPFASNIYSPEELRAIQLAATRRFYFRPGSIVMHLKSINSWHAFFQKAKLGLRFMGISK